MTDLVGNAEAFRLRCDEFRRHGERVALVPTMGALHAGHFALFDRAREGGATKVAVSVFVNPLQFGPHEDYARYPRTLERDLAECERRNVDLVFAPNAAALFPDSFGTRVQVLELGSILEGKVRPGHFDGVATVVTKLLCLTGPCVAVFGEKDYQQLRVIKRVVEDLNLPVEILSQPIVRAEDGLALSSRNRFLRGDQRQRALALPQGLNAASEAWSRGERSVAALRQAALGPIARSFDVVDYVEVVDPGQLQPLSGSVPHSAVVLGAARLGGIRLIDNISLTSFAPRSTSPPIPTSRQG